MEDNDVRQKSTQQKWKCLKIASDTTDWGDSLTISGGKSGWMTLTILTLVAVGSNLIFYSYNATTANHTPFLVGGILLIALAALVIYLYNYHMSIDYTFDVGSRAFCRDTTVFKRTSREQLSSFDDIQGVVLMGRPLQSGNRSPVDKPTWIYGLSVLISHAPTVDIVPCQEIDYDNLVADGEGLAKLMGRPFFHKAPELVTSISYKNNQLTIDFQPLGSSMV